MCRSVALFVSAIAVLSPSMPIGAAPGGDDQHVREVIEKFNAYRRARDAAKMASLYTDNAEFWPREEQPVIRGRAEIERQFKAIFADVGVDGQVTRESLTPQAILALDAERVIRSVQFVRPDVAVVRTAMDIRNDLLVDVFVITKERGDWKIASRHTARIVLPKSSTRK